jgi:hypothetical protein
MRRCQRLPDVTHPVDPTRPADQSIKSHARADRAKTSPKRELQPPASCAGDDRLTSPQNDFVDPKVV